MLTHYATNSHGVAVIIARSSVTDNDALRLARDLRCGFRVELPTGVSIARTGGYPNAYTVWPAR